MNASLRLSSLHLFQFKSYASQQIDFPGRIVGFCGPNGAGKTNLLDAIYYLCLTKGYFSRSDGSNVMFGHQGFRIEGVFEKAERIFKICVILRENGKKELTVNGEVYSRFSDHIGKFPVVVVAPDDSIIFTGASEERRKWLDTLQSQINPSYLQQLIRYNRLLTQRNSLLKQFFESGRRDMGLLEVIDAQLVESGQFIFTARRDFMEIVLPEIIKLYKRLAGRDDGLRISYESQLSERSFSELLALNRDRDFISMRTTTGIHKDEIAFSLQDQPFRQLASQGQRKTALFALKIAEFNMIQTFNGTPPLLLLDDVFEKLDEERMQNLLHWACKDNTGQVFLTDTHPERLESVLKELNVDFHIEKLG
jgi:DNA replication and repair protein RecF